MPTGAIEAWMLMGCISYFSVDVINNMTKATYRKKKSLFWLKALEGKIHNDGDSTVLGSRHGFRSRNLRAHILDQKHKVGRAN